ncbi:hypothetical protein QT711_18030 [Sporosarcina saromensis]|uniref:Uncharacterized protein n=1 Tax=Sporosarcina saromensis TaxID=359365 RepID=A0ABU4GDL9_9BACL|nr:hypothetical protein [Sporosarcina saromensis]MDW0115064.1 hypothetical protein [Sporosarcina saromensis]
MHLPTFIHSFFELIKLQKIEIYNEFSLQHEHGLYLRNHLDSSFKIQFERNIKFFGITEKLIKKELDIVIYNSATHEKYAIELKFPKNGQHPETMFNFAKDIKFMEQIKNHGFTHTYAITFAEDKLFYSGINIAGIYEYFRSDTPLHGEITKPTGKRDEQFYINGSYTIQWNYLVGSSKYYLLEI